MRNGPVGSGPMKLIVGLGNPGEKYSRNRHNVGFMTLERMCAHHQLGSWRKKFNALTCDGRIGDHKVLLLRPQTYYNEAGQSVGEAARFHKIDIADIIVFHDEIDLVPGKLRVKVGGGNAGNNGLRSITAHLGAEFVRVRIGVGHPGSKDAVAHYVLHDFPKGDAEGLDVMLDAMARSADRLLDGDHNRFQTAVSQALSDFINDDEPAKASKTTKSPPNTRQQSEATHASGSSKQKAARHPAGERDNKRKTALAENLQRWLSGRKTTNEN